MVHHFTNLVFQAIASMPARIGSNWGGVLFSIGLFVIAQVLALMTLGVALTQWKAHWRTNVLAGVITVVVGWLALFAISLVATVYDDHENLVGAAHRIKSRNEKTSQDLQLQISSLKVDCAGKEATRQTLEKQSRDQQDTLNTCVTALAAANKPEKLAVVTVGGNLPVSDWSMGPNTNYGYVVVQASRSIPAYGKVTCNTPFVIHDGLLRNPGSGMSFTNFPKTPQTQVTVNNGLPFGGYGSMLEFTVIGVGLHADSCEYSPH